MSVNNEDFRTGGAPAEGGEQKGSNWVLPLGRGSC